MSHSQSVVGWPLTSGGAPIGVLLLAWREPQQLNNAQLAYISAVATMVSQALVRAKGLRRRARPRGGAAGRRVAHQSGGVHRIGRLRVTYEPADVARGLGRGLVRHHAATEEPDLHRGRRRRRPRAAAVEDMAQLRSGGRVLAHQGLPPAQLLAELNGFTRHASQGKFATMAIAVYDPATAC